MSKAFTREDDALSDEALPVRSLLPPGVTNYLTADGAERFRRELEQLVRVKRPALAAAKDADPDAAGQLRRVDQRIAELVQALESAEVVSPPSGDTDEVQFGATVTVRDPGGEEDTYRIVGVDEVDAERGWVSWLSPIARVLLNHRAGEEVKLRMPAGERTLFISQVRYET